MLMLTIAALALQVEDDPRCSPMKRDDLAACSYDMWQSAAKKLNEQWDRMSHPEELVEAQREWLKWRDAECAAQNPAAGGREEVIWHNACLAELTEARTKQLRNAYPWLQKPHKTSKAN